MRNLPSRFPRRENGSMTVIALIVCGIGSVGLLGMLSLMEARFGQVDATEEKAIRHVRYLNGRQLAKAFAYQGMIQNTSGSAVTLEISGGWGRITVPAWSDSVVSTSSLSTAFNHISPRSVRNPYFAGSAFQIHSNLNADGTWDTAAAADTVNVRTFGSNPALNGILLDLRKPHNNVINSISGNLVVQGQAMIFQREALNNSIAFEAQRYNAEVGALGLSNFAVSGAARADNLPHLPMMENWNGANTYIKGDRWLSGGSSPRTMPLIAQSQGALSLDASAVYDADGIDSDGSGTVEINLGNPNLPPVVITGALTQLDFIGQADAGAMVAVENFAPALVIANSGSLGTISFSGSNNRALVLGVWRDASGAGSPVFAQFESNSFYRLFLAVGNRGLTVSTPDNLTIRGGLFLDYDNYFGPGNVTLEREPDADLVDTLLQRQFWVEMYQQL